MKFSYDTIPTFYFINSVECHIIITNTLIKIISLGVKINVLILNVQLH